MHESLSENTENLINAAQGSGKAAQRRDHMFQAIRPTPPPTQIWEGKGGVFYSLNPHYRGSALKDVIKYFTTFFASKFFSLFSSSKT